jgi:hypothetical protein
MFNSPSDREDPPMLQEELDVSLLAGHTVVEIGCRQAWPFLELIDPSAEREIRLYIDADVRIEGDGGGTFGQEDTGLLAALARILNCAIERAETAPGGDLHVTFSDGYALVVSGDDNANTTAAPWWFGLVSSCPGGTCRDARHNHGESS